MSLLKLSASIDDLPYALSEQVLSYARTLELAAPEIFKDAGLKFNREIADMLVFIAGLRKLYSIVDSNYWVIDNTGAILANQEEQYSVRVGATDLSRGGEYHQSLIAVRNGLAELLDNHHMLEYVRDLTYVEVLRELTNGR